MNNCLVFPPQIIPTSAPLGIALLKSYIGAETKEKVKAIDLNLEFHKEVIDNFIEGKFRLYNDNKKNSKAVELIRKASSLFREKSKDFFNPEEYNPCANEFLYLFEKVYLLYVI